MNQKQSKELEEQEKIERADRPELKSIFNPSNPIPSFRF